MAFEAYNPTSNRGGGIGPRTPRPDVVRMGCYSNKGSFSVVLTLGSVVRDKLRWRIGDGILVLRGTGADNGLVQLTLCPDTQRRHFTVTVAGGSAKSNENALAKRAVAVKINPAALLPDNRKVTKTYEAVDVEHQAFGGTLTVKLPAWATA